MTAASMHSAETLGVAAVPMPTVWSPDAFAESCRSIVSTMQGHAAHRALDLLTNDVLRSLGFGEGVAIFEASVAKWHIATVPYPYPAACPSCEAA